MDIYYVLTLVFPIVFYLLGTYLFKKNNTFKTILIATIAFIVSNAIDLTFKTDYRDNLYKIAFSITGISITYLFHRYRIKKAED